MNAKDLRRAALAVLFSLLPLTLLAQGVDPPLRLQGLDRSMVPGVRAAGMGGVSIAIGGTANAVFTNPAALSELQTFDLRLGLGWSEHRTRQTQYWIPNRFYTNLSLLMENLVDQIKDPVVTDPRDALQKPYDDLTPNWKDLQYTLSPGVLSAAMPVDLGGVRAVIALGGAQVFDLNYYYRNNNGMEPNIGQYRPEPIPVVRGSDTLVARWFSSTHERTGAVYGITPGFSIDLLGDLSLGAGVTILTGKSDDDEVRVDRGRLVFDAVYRFRNDSVYYRKTATGSSTYGGFIPTFGAQYRGRYFSAGAALKLPATITREWDRTTTIDTTGSSTVLQESGSDELQIPLSYALGFALHPGPDWKIGVDYVVRQYEDAEVTAGGSTTNPWLGGKMLRLGAEFRAARWIALRGGYREEVGVFIPDGTGLLDEPVRGSVYTVGLGLTFGPVTVDLAYEYLLLKYQDVWETNVNDNKRVQHSILTEFSIAL